ncbi:MAG: cysteine--tRNA ligase [Deltaproteobacteria bacterium]|nr:cysteine--tRNA ligase [Deltaproteobacteria bacterium]
MTIRLYNTMRRQKEDLETGIAGQVSMYVCGVTVYDRSHIGHARCYVAFDVVYRYLRHAGFQVRYVRNFTDVDDKIIRRAAELGVGPRDLASDNIALFHQDMDLLGCLRPDVEPRVTDHIPEIIRTIQDILDRGHGYVAAGSVYFDIATFPAYGRLSGRALEEMQAGASERVEDDPHKKDPMDFVLWKPAKPGEPAWESPWGPGRPGWHIECSAMSRTHLGETFDIHGGGKDLVFPHHENEVAQSEAASGHSPFVRYWMHNGFVNINAEKMSKSLGNFFTIAEVLERYHPEALRLFLLGTHYRSPLNFSDAILEETTARLEYLYETLLAVDEAVAAGGPEGGSHPGLELLDGVSSRVREAMDDDFNTAAALGHLSELARLANETVKSRRKTPGRLEVLRKVREVASTVSSIFGILARPPAKALEEIRRLDCHRRCVDPSDVEACIRRRAMARQEKDFAASDRIRDDLAGRGVQLMDTPAGTAWKLLKRTGEEP